MSSNLNTRTCCQRTYRYTLLWNASQKKTPKQRNTNSHRVNKPNDDVVCTDGSVTRGRFGLELTVKQGGRTVHEDRRAGSLDFQSDHGGPFIKWLASQSITQITHPILLTDSMNLLQKVESWMGVPKLAHCHVKSSSANVTVDLLPWPCRSQREWTGRPTGKHSRRHNCLQLGRVEVLWGSRSFLNTNRPKYRRIGR